MALEHIPKTLNCCPFIIVTSMVVSLGEKVHIAHGPIPFTYSLNCTLWYILGEATFWGETIGTFGRLRISKKDHESSDCNKRTILFPITFSGRHLSILLSYKILTHKPLNLF